MAAPSDSDGAAMVWGIRRKWDGYKTPRAITIHSEMNSYTLDDQSRRVWTVKSTSMDSKVDEYGQ